MSRSTKRPADERAMPKRRLWASVCETATGSYIGLAASAYGLVASTLPCTTHTEARQGLLDCLNRAALRGWFEQPEWLASTSGLPPHLAAARECLAAVKSAQRFAALQQLQLDLRPHPPFTARVLDAVHGIAPGETCTYGDVAKRAGVPGAARAVGQVMARNPLAPVVPCHRVLGVGGLIGGFAGGSEMKAQMLRDEGLAVDAGRVRGRKATTNE